MVLYIKLISLCVHVQRFGMSFLSLSQIKKMVPNLTPIAMPQGMSFAPYNAIPTRNVTDKNKF